MSPDMDMTAPDEANDRAFARPDEGRPTVDFDVGKILFLISFLEKVRNHILSKNKVLTEQNLKDIIEGLKERL